MLLRLNVTFQIIDDVIYVYFVAEMLIKMVKSDL